MKARKSSMAMVALAALAGAGCVERTIKITSDPPGALVRLNDEEVGRTPLTVPFTFYGVYDVRLEAEPIWLTPEEAAEKLGSDVADISRMAEKKEIESRKTPDGKTVVKVWYRPLWTQQQAKAPWWEAPGPDLIAEAVPRNKTQQEWHFKLDATPGSTPEAVVDRAKQLRAMVRQERVESPE